MTFGVRRLVAAFKSAYLSALQDVISLFNCASNERSYGDKSPHTKALTGQRTPKIYRFNRDAITFVAVAPAPTAPLIVGASGFATSPTAKTFSTLVSCTASTIT